MDEIEQIPLHQITPEMREAMRQQIVVDKRYASEDLVTALQVRSAMVVRMVERFEAVGAVRLVRKGDWSGAVAVDPHSLSERFCDLDTPLW